MHSPRRVQRQRLRGWRMPNCAVAVDRSTSFGNPFTTETAIKLGFAFTEAGARQVVVDEHREWLEGKGDQDVYTFRSRTFDRRWVLGNLHRLKGRDLACFCPLPGPGLSDVCHAATLLGLANGGAA